MDIFLAQKHWFTSEGLYETPRAVCSAFFWWMDVLYFASKSQPPFTAIIKLGIIYFYNSDCIHLKYESHIYLGWLKCE